MNNLVEENSKNSTNKKIKNSLDLDYEALFTGVQINYYVHCKTQLWLFSHKLEREGDSELVAIGKLLHEETFKRFKKEIIVDQKISLDFVKVDESNRIIIHDVKKSDKFKLAHYYQMLYYLYYLKKKKGIFNAEGIINYPLQKKRIRVKLTEDEEKKIENILKEIEKIVSLKTPPKPEYKNFCKNCSYFEFCFAE